MSHVCVTICIWIKLTKVQESLEVTCSLSLTNRFVAHVIRRQRHERNNKGIASDGMPAGIYTCGKLNQCSFVTQQAEKKPGSTRRIITIVPTKGPSQDLSALISQMKNCLATLAMATEVRSNRKYCNT